MRFLVTGAYGQLGHELKRFSTVETVYSDRHIVDVTKYSEVLEYFHANRNVDAVLNCAAATNVDSCEEQQKEAYLINAIGARNVAIACDKIGAKLIHISTDYVFDGKATSPICEWEIPNPQSVYGFTKLAGEEYVKQFCKQSFIVRTSWLNGSRGHNFEKTILNEARAGRPLKVVSDQIGNPTYAADLAKQLLRLAETEEYGLYHCTNNGECSWYDFAHEFLKLSGLEYSIVPCTTEEYPRPAKRPAYSSLENMMLSLTIGDRMRGWKDAIAEFMTLYNKDTGEFEV
jgi:dTDP-4-dehydrorhamnose reductase